MQEFSMCLDCHDHARRDAGTVAEPTNASRRCPSAAQEPPDFRLDACPSAVREFSQQAAVEASVESPSCCTQMLFLPRHVDIFPLIRSFDRFACEPNNFRIRASNPIAVTPWPMP